MSDIKLFQEIQRLDHLFKKVSLIEDEEMKAHWAKYLCILVSGHIENAVKHLISKYASEKSHQFVSNYVNNNIKSITNMNNTKICSFLGSFSDQWREAYETIISDEEIDAVNSVVANRHNIAHGKSVGLSFVRMSVYYQNVSRVIEIIDTLCINTSDERRSAYKVDENNS